MRRASPTAGGISGWAGNLGGPGPPRAAFTGYHKGNAQLGGRGRELAGLEPAVQAFKRYQQVTAELEELGHLLASKDAEMAALAKEERDRHEQEQQRLLDQLEASLLQEGAQADRPLIVEIRPGTGGLEAGLFAADLFRMYSKYATRIGLKVETMDSNATEAAGSRRSSFPSQARGAWRHFHFESGVHRVQRVPATES